MFWMYGCKVYQIIVLWVLIGQNMVVCGVFVKVQIVSIICVKKQYFVEFYYVVGVIGFWFFDVFYYRGEIVVIVEVFMYIVVFYIYVVMLIYGILEECCCFFLGGVIVQFCDMQGINDFWNLCVGV